MKYLITGHTGFKGTWLTLFLRELGHEVSGLSLDPEPGCLFDLADVAAQLTHDFRGDIRSTSVVQEVLAVCSPDVVLHLAAQPLVRESYRNPRVTFETNVMGTLNVLQAVSVTPSVKAQVIVTTDKVYRNVGQRAGYGEDDPLGGDDPYSASKAMADILVHSWAVSFGGPATAVARAGNVIGGGDISPERLLPDVVQACRSGRSPVLRYPDAVRPWQHVLDCLNGYRMLVDHLITDGGSSDRGAWNFGPDPANLVTVAEVTERTLRHWGLPSSWVRADGSEFPESALLSLNAGKSVGVLGWHDRLSLDAAIAWTMDWYRQVDEGNWAIDVTVSQIRAFLARAQ